MDLNKVLLIIVNFGIVQGLPEEEDYHSLYNDWVQTYKNSTNTVPVFCQGCLNTAENKANGFEQYSEAEKDAVKVVNLYTQSNRTNQDEKIYLHLNNQLRCNNLTSVMKTSKKLLNRAIDMLSSKNTLHIFDVFRGTTHFIDVQENENKVFAAFTSTSMSPEEAFNYGVSKGSSDKDCVMFLVIKNVTGLAIQNYSAIPQEKEVLLKSGTIYHVTTILKNNQEAIRKEMEEYWLNFANENKTINTLLVGEYIPDHSYTNKLDECNSPDKQYSATLPNPEL